MSFVNGIRFTDGKKTDTMMTWNSIRSSWNTSILEDVDRNTKRFGKTRMKISRRSWCLYFEYFHKIENQTHNVIDLRSSPKKKEFDFVLSHDEDLTLSDFALSLISTEISKWKIPNRYQRIECPTQDRKFHQVIKNEVVQFCNSMNFNTFKNIYIYIYIYIFAYAYGKIWIFFKVNSVQRLLVK